MLHASDLFRNYDDQMSKCDSWAMVIWCDCGGECVWLVRTDRQRVAPRRQQVPGWRMADAGPGVARIDNSGRGSSFRSERRAGGHGGLGVDGAEGRDSSLLPLAFSARWMGRFGRNLG